MASPALPGDRFAQEPDKQATYEKLSRHVESLAKELSALEGEAAELAREIEELTGKAAPGAVTV